MDTWRTWELVLPSLERHHDVLAPTLAGHHGGPRLSGAAGDGELADAVERAMDSAGFARAHLVGNSLGGWLALQLAARGRATSVVAFAPAGGWVAGDRAFVETLDLQAELHAATTTGVAHAEQLVASPAGRRRVTGLTTVNYEHLAPELLVAQLRGVAGCDVRPLLAWAQGAAWELDAEGVTCPVRIAWGTEDRLLPWPRSAERLRRDWLPQADWIELDGVGHCPQLDVPLEAAHLILGHTTG